MHRDIFLFAMLIKYTFTGGRLGKKVRYIPSRNVLRFIVFACIENVQVFTNLKLQICLSFPS